MECQHVEELSNEEFLRQFQRKAMQQRIPLSGMIALTHRCNLHCIHCYLGEERNCHPHNGQEVETSKWHALIDEVTDAGSLALTISGGEPLLRQDFAEIYRHAKTNGLLVTVFTNGTLISNSLLSLFQDLPPRNIDISVYGATAETYAKITGVKDAYTRCWQGIEALVTHGIPVSLKTILMTLNQHEFDAIEELAQKHGVPFRFNAEIIPCFNDDRRPIELRIPPKDIIEKELSSQKRVDSWTKFMEKRLGMRWCKETLYRCGSGMTGFAIDPYGYLYPCLMARHIRYDLLTGSFLEGWRTMLPQIQLKKAPERFPCRQCEAFVVCGYCPPTSAWETGKEEIPAEYRCQLNKLRFTTLKERGLT